MPHVIADEQELYEMDDSLPIEIVPIEQENNQLLPDHPIEMDSEQNEKNQLLPQASPDRLPPQDLNFEIP